MDQFIEESKNTLADLISIKGSTIEFLDPDVKIQKVDPSKRMLRFCLLFDTFGLYTSQD